MRPSRRWLARFALAVALLVAPVAHASLIAALDLPTMVARADQIAVVDVAAVNAAWNARGDRIMTTIDLVVVESWKGAAAPATHLQLVQPGGTVADVTTTVDGMPRFTVGERVLVFLHGPDGHRVVVGMTQGRRPVQRDATGHHWMVNAPARAGADFVRVPAGASGAPVLTAGPRPLEDLRREVRTLSASSANPSPGGGR